MKRLNFLLCVSFIVLLVGCENEKFVENSNQGANFELPHRIDLRASLLDSTILETSNYTVDYELTSTVRYTLGQGSFEYQDNANPGNWIGLSSGSGLEITCSCDDGTGICKVKIASFGNTKTYTCEAMDEECTDCDMKVIITDGFQSDTITNGVIVR